DGIRDPLVTGVQTCALPIFYAVTTVEDVTAVKRAEFEQHLLADAAEALAAAPDYASALEALSKTVVPRLADWCSLNAPGADGTKIGRASCREGGSTAVGARG